MEFKPSFGIENVGGSKFRQALNGIIESELLSAGIDLLEDEDNEDQEDPLVTSLIESITELLERNGFQC